MRFLLFTLVALFALSAGTALAESPTQWYYGYSGPQDADVVSLWHMDEDAGNGVDAVDGNYFDHWFDPVHVGGQFGKAMPFNGTQDWARNDKAIGVGVWDPLLNVSNTGYTVEMWVKPTGSQGGYKGFADNAAGFLFRYGGGTDGLQAIIWFQGGANTAIMDSDPDVITPDVWQHVALTYSGDVDHTIRMYVNGVVVAEQSEEWMIDPVQTEGMVVFGANKGGGYNWAGAMDEVRISSVGRDFAPIPEPCSMAALAFGVIGLALRRRR